MPSEPRDEDLAIRGLFEEPRRVYSAPGQATVPQAKADHPAAEIAESRQALARPDNPPRARPDDAAGRGARGSRAWSDRRAPNGEDDAPARSGHRSRESGNSGPDGGALAGGREESSGSGHRSPPSAHCHRGASPPGSRRTPDAGTFPRKRAPRHRARTVPADPDRPAPGHRRGPPPGSAPPGRRDRGGAGPTPRAGPGRRPAAGPARAFPRKRPQGSRPPRPAPAGRGSRG